LDGELCLQAAFSKTDLRSKVSSFKEHPLLVPSFSLPAELVTSVMPNRAGKKQVLL
jgi:hypothetical protein